MKLFKSIFLFLTCALLSGQETPQKIRFVSVMEDLPKVGIYTINQDDYGFIWLGTNGSGLYRYDGQEYKSYRHVLNDSTSLSSSMVYCTYLDNRHRLWVGTEEGLNLYDKNNDQFIRIPTTKFGVPTGSNLSIRSLIEDESENLYIGTFGRGMYKMDLDNFKVEEIKSSKLNKEIPVTVYVMEFDHNGKLYTATNLGVQEYAVDKNELRPAVFSKGESLHVPIQSLVIDGKNNIWAGSNSNGLYKIGYENDDFSHRTIQSLGISENLFFSLEVIDRGGILCGTENDGLYHVDDNGKLIRHYVSSNKDEESLLSNSIWSLYQDRNNKIWLGYYNKGVTVYDEVYDKFNGYESLYNNPNSLHTASVASIDQDKSGNLWVGMDGGGIDIINKKTKAFTHINSEEKGKYSGLTSDYILSVFIDSHENVWAGSWDHGVYFLKKGTSKFVNFNIDNTEGGLKSNTVVSIAEDAEGTIWFATFRNGLHSYNPKTGLFTYYDSTEFEEHGIQNHDAWKVLVDHEDNIWLGTTYGLYKIEKQENGGFHVISMFERMAETYNNATTANHILSLYESEDKAIWIGTKGAGLCKYDTRSDTFTWFNKLKGFPLENVCGIIESGNDNIWAAGNSGIVKLDKKTKEVTNFLVNDGLLSNDYNMNAVFKDMDGNLYFGGYEGLDFFTPGKIKFNKQETLLYLSDFKIFNKKVLPTQENSPLAKVISETDSITLTSKQSVFTIEYSGINYTRPEKNEYAYYLAGYEDTWNYVGNARSATYTNLDPGQYTFKLKSSNNDGVWNVKPLELHITILPPWWKTNWALSGYLVMLLSGLVVLNKLTQKRIRKKQLEKYEEDKRVQEKELNEKKFQFFTNISHEFRTPLTLIMNPLQDIINNHSPNLPQKIREKHAIIQKNTERLHRLVNELLDFRKLEINKIRLKAKEIDLVDLTGDVISHFKEEAIIKNIDLTFDIDDETLLVWADENLLEKVIFNVISNAFKATPEGGTINVALFSKGNIVNFPLVGDSYKSQAVEIVISDTGVGLEKDQMKRMFERFYQVESQNQTYYGGTGIGLEVVQSFVELHKGIIEVESELGKGTSFKIILPLGKNHLSEKELDQDPCSSLENEQQNFVPNRSLEEVVEADISQKQLENANNYTLLIVEDNIELRNYLKEEFRLQYKVICVNNGMEGIKLAKEMLPDVIITDVIMPQMSGFEFCKNIKTDIRTSHIPVLMLTAKAKIEDRIEGIEIGADAYMIKPFDIRLLRLRLSQLITSRQLIFNKYFSAISDVSEGSNTTTSLDKEFIQKALDYINSNIENPDIGVESLASHLNLSRSQVYRKIKALTNQTANEFIRNVRLHKAKILLQSGNYNISDISYAVGFSSSSYFTKCFKTYFGVVPTQIIEESEVKQSQTNTE